MWTAGDERERGICLMRSGWTGGERAGTTRPTRSAWTAGDERERGICVMRSAWTGGEQNKQQILQQPP